MTTAEGSTGSGPLRVRLRQRRGDDLVIVRHRQHAFSAIVIGILVNICILNLFVEHVEEVVIDSFSISMLTAILLSVMVWTVAGFEHRVSGWFARRPGRGWRVAGFLAVWGILFISKFVILEVVDVVFGDHVQLGHLLEVILLVFAMLIAQRLIESFYDTLGRRWGPGDDSEPTQSFATCVSGSGAGRQAGQALFEAGRHLLADLLHHEAEAAAALEALPVDHAAARVGRLEADRLGQRGEEHQRAGGGGEGEVLVLVPGREDLVDRQSPRRDPALPADPGGHARDVDPVERGEPLRPADVIGEVSPHFGGRGVDLDRPFDAHRRGVDPLGRLDDVLRHQTPKIPVDTADSSDGRSLRSSTRSAWAAAS